MRRRNGQTSDHLIPIIRPVLLAGFVIYLLSVIYLVICVTVHGTNGEIRGAARVLMALSHVVDTQRDVFFSTVAVSTHFSVEAKFLVEDGLICEDIACTRW